MNPMVAETLTHLKAGDVPSTAQSPNRALEEVGRALKALREPPFHFYEIVDLIREIVVTIEYIVDGPTKGKDKHQLAREVFREIDKEFKLSKAIAKLFSKGVFILRILPFRWREKAAGVAVDIIIHVLVFLFNLSIWK